MNNLAFKPIPERVPVHVASVQSFAEAYVSTTTKPEPYTYTRTKFTAVEEEIVRVMTNPDGRDDMAYDREKYDAMPLQDRLLEAEVTFAGNTGIAIEYRWESGRKDVWVQLDLADECVSPEMRLKHWKLLNNLKGADHE